jgi:hypothetical protein
VKGREEIAGSISYKDNPTSNAHRRGRTSPAEGLPRCSGGDVTKPGLSTGQVIRREG